MSQLFASDGQSIGGSASASVLPMNSQSWFPLGLSSLISLLFKGLSRVFSSTMVWKHGFFSTQPSKGFPCGSAGKESACNVGDLGSIPGLGRSPGEGKRLPTPVHWPVEFHGLQSMGSKRVWLFKRHDWATFTLSFLYGPILTVNGTLQIRLTKTKLTGGGKKNIMCAYEKFKEINKSPKGVIRLRSLYIILTKGNKFVEVFPVGSLVKNPPANAGDAGSIPGLGSSLREGNGNPLQYSCLGNPMDKVTWLATVHGITKESDMI